MGSWMCKFHSRDRFHPSDAILNSLSHSLGRSAAREGFWEVLPGSPGMSLGVPGAVPSPSSGFWADPARSHLFPEFLEQGMPDSPGGAACALGSHPRGKGAFSAFFCVLTPTNPCTKGSPCLQAGTSRGILLLWVGLELSELKFLLEEPESPCQSQSSLEIPLQMEFGGF